ncbi:MAG TPA: C13 family peptidase [Steroidobacteraceae bacterium]|nr:C13 family peptidase [Steroidobacteraceae bacterium]
MIPGRILLVALLLLGGACVGGEERRSTHASHDELAAQPAQHALIDEQLSRFVVDPAPPGRVFFLGFAGYGEQKVFAEEIKLAARRVGERYGSTARTLLLINDRRDLTTMPLATHDNLRYSLRELARRMNPETDVLFLVLSSHGARNGMIEVSNTGMEALGLSPASVDLLTREAGIRMRVVVVSACFSGAFVEPLANNDTVVLTAASRSRSSFGCSDDRHLTWFGEALFQDALPGASTLREAFKTTRGLVRVRERKLRATASQPQSYFGPVVESRLAEIEAARRQGR